ncbi:MAG: ATP-binding protein [Chloroflexota bacterium]|nr:MAG: ATP-binding protein [Chloroflexota bacterium]
MNGNYADPVFVNRRTELQLFNDVLTALGAGERRHLALLGLRRIGKTILLDEVRARHPDACIVKIAIDTVVATPEGFALDIAALVLQGALRARGHPRTVTTQPRSLAAAAGLLGSGVTDHLDELLGLVDPAFGGEKRSYGQLLNKVFAFPAVVSDAANVPILMMLDEFQDIRKLLRFPGTDTLWAALREALDRRGRVAFVVAGSIVTAMRAILHEGNDPLFSRFQEVPLPPFGPEDTRELAEGVWYRIGLRWDQNASQRVHTLSQGFPLYAHVLAREAIEPARAAGGPVLGEHVDAAFERQIFDRNSQLSLYMQYLLEHALHAVQGENIPEAVLRTLAQAEGRRLSDLARSVHRPAPQLGRVVQQLISIDILRRDADGALWFADPVFPLWLATERDRQEPGLALRDPRTRERVMETLAERLRALQGAIGPLFERRVHNIARQFRGQTVSRNLFGLDGGTIALPSVTDVHNLHVADPDGLVGAARSTTEIDGVTVGSEFWLIEAKRVRHAVTVAVVARVLKKRVLVERAHDRKVDRVWIVSDAGFRTDARDLCEREGVLMTGARELTRLERAVAS